MGFFTSPVLIAFIAAVATFLIWQAIVKKRREATATVAEKRLDKFMTESGLYEDIDMTTAAQSVEKPDLVDKMTGFLARQGFISTLESGDILAWLNRKLILAGSPKGWTGTDFLGFYALVLGSGLVLSFLLLVSGGLPTFIIALFIIVVALYPFAWLNRLVKTRQTRAFAELPDFIDDLVLSLSSGMSVLDEAIERVLREESQSNFVKQKRQNVLVHEFGRAYREYKHGGRDRAEAFLDAADRIGIQEVDTFVEGINEAYLTGSPILEALQGMSTHIYAIYEQRMVEYIEKKSVTFVISLTCIMFGVMIIIGAPILPKLFPLFLGEPKDKKKRAKLFYYMINHMSEHNDKNEPNLATASAEMRKNMERFQSSDLGKDRPPRKIPQEPISNFEEEQAEPVTISTLSPEAPTPTQAEVQTPGAIPPEKKTEEAVLLTSSGKTLGETLPSSEEVQKVIAEPEEKIDIEQFIHELNMETQQAGDSLGTKPLPDLTPVLQPKVNIKEKPDIGTGTGTEAPANITIEKPQAVKSEQAQKRERLLDIAKDERTQSFVSKPPDPGKGKNVDMHTSDSFGDLSAAAIKIINALFTNENCSEIHGSEPSKLFARYKGHRVGIKAEFASEKEYNSFLKDLVDKAETVMSWEEIKEKGRGVVRIADGSSLTLTFPPLTQYATFSVRKHTAQHWSFDQLVGNGSMNKAMGEFLKLCAASRINMIIAGELGSGKAQPLDAPILTPTGWQTMGGLARGDRVIGLMGEPVSVEGIYPQGEQDIYKLTFTDGTSCESTADHLWAVYVRGRSCKKPIQVLPLTKLQEKLLDKNGQPRYFVPLTKPVQFAVSEELSRNPYLFAQELKGKEKIPEIYKFASIQQRTAFLQGLLEKKMFSFSSLALAEDVQFIIQSLGGIAKIERKGEQDFRVNVANLKSISQKRRRRYLQTVEYVGKKEAQCIKVSTADGLYLTESCLVTHNTTLLSLLSQYFGEEERIALLQEVPEIFIYKPDVVQFVYYPSDFDEKYALDKVIDTALYMRFDRLIVGEVHDKGIFYLLKGMRTGSDGSMSTFHSGSSREVIDMLKNHLMMENSNFTPAVAADYIRGAIDLIVVLEHQGQQHRVMEITEVDWRAAPSTQTDMVSANTLWKFDRKEGIQGRHINLGRPDEEGRIMKKMRRVGATPNPEWFAASSSNIALEARKARRER